jgi:hypothetical protein
MTDSNRDQLPPDLAQMGERLRAERSHPTPVELDRILTRAQATARRSRPGSGLKGALVKSRLAITSMVVMGLVFSGTGGALALSGSSGDINAAQAEYCQPGNTPPPCGETLAPPPAPLSQSEEPLTPEADDTLEGETRDDVAGVTDEGGSGGGGSETLQPLRQIENQSDDDLPFTGYAAIPLILVGLMLLAGGLLLRRESQRTTI